MNKKCNRCGEWKDISADFFANPSSSDGIRSICKVCTMKTTRKYEIRNRERIRGWRKQERKKRLSHYREENRASTEHRRKTHPWEQSYYMAQNRCRSWTRTSAPYYVGKGIKFLLTHDEVKALWFRDNAALLKWASLDRIDPGGNYELGNCRFIEFSENSRRANKKLKEPKKP